MHGNKGCYSFSLQNRSKMGNSKLTKPQEEALQDLPIIYEVDWDNYPRRMWEGATGKVHHGNTINALIRKGIIEKYSHAAQPAVRLSNS